MKNSPLLTICSLLLVFAPVISSGEDFLLYAPKPATGEHVPASPDQGVLVRSVTVKRGDTLRHLSRKHLGVASWFPQVLLFNTIKNPDLIYPGEKLLVPVPSGHNVSAEKAGKVKKHAAAKKIRSRHKGSYKATTYKRSKGGSRQLASTEQESYQQAKRAYISGDYRKSLELFDSFLGRFPDSKLAADASLYRADCYLRLSGQ